MIKKLAKWYLVWNTIFGLPPFYLPTSIKDKYQQVYYIFWR